MSSPDRGAAALVMAAAALTLVAAGADAQSLLTREEALALAYPGADITAERLFLTAEQQRRAAEAAGGPVASALVARYTARRNGRDVGRAYVDTHVVRTKKETLLVSLDAAGAVLRIDVTAFLEPPEYQAPDVFMRQYQGRPLSDDLRLHRAIRPIAGATLTATATTEAVRRVLAIDALLAGARGGER